MKRWTIRICVFLLLGAIVNVAVAWTLAATIHIGDRDFDGGIAGDERIRIQIYRWQMPGGYLVSCGWQIFEVQHATSGGVSPNDLPRWYPSDRVAPQWLMDAKDGSQDDVIEARGWPALALFSWHRFLVLYDESGMPSGSEAHQFAGIPLKPWASQNMSWRGLPTRPIWPGFAINTVFYAVILWGLFAGPFVVRRWRRIRRGLCPKCAYDLRGTPEATACPECGAPSRTVSQVNPTRPEARG